MLEQIAEIGVARGEFGELLYEHLGEMKASDPQKVEALEQDAKELMSMSRREAVKAKAREMLAKLEPPEEE